MLRFLVRRTLGAAAVLLLISAFTFFLFFSIPQDPALLACGKNCTADAVALIHRNLGLDDPVPLQYAAFMTGIVTGREFAAGPCPAPCFGYSFANDRPVFETLADRFPTTASLTVGGAVVFLAVGLGAGMIAAARRGTATDKVVSSVSLVLSSMQIYFLGPVVLGVLVYGTGLLPSPSYVPLTEDPAGWFTGLLIPWCVMAVIFTANYTRMARSTLIEQLQEDHVRTARAKGMPSRTVFFRYAWRGSLIPIVTIFGMDLGSLFGGAMITEFTFGLAGLGRLAVDSVIDIDLPMIMGVMLFSSALILLCNIVVDAAYALIDPRVRLDAGSSA
ncbi:ABC transporter permease [Streptomyces thermolineatus]|uniref:ABC transporter permease n=1 Tax=Streptomyces thermolineatus TaxID=44033 RepID=UPI0038507FC8